MSGAARVGDVSKGPKAEARADHGSPNVSINGQPALRFGDGGPTWALAGGARGVFINGRLAGRSGDPTRHSDGDGKTVSGSSNVLIGDNARTSKSAKPVLRIRVAFAGGPPLSNEHVQVLDAKGAVVAAKHLDEDGMLDVEEGIDWGTHRVRTESGLLLRLG